MFTANYVKKYSTYEPTKFEWLEDLLATNKSAQAPVSLIFLVRKSKAKFNIPTIFQAPNTLVYNKPRKYWELEYRIQTTKLQMEFYLLIFEFCFAALDTPFTMSSMAQKLCVLVW